MVAFTFALISLALTSVTAYPNHVLESRQARKPDFSKWAPTDKTNMAPCPFTNALANHGFLPRKAMTEGDIKSSLTEVLQLDGILANLFATQSSPLGYTLADGTKVVDLGQLDKHGGAIEHDASLSRSDFFFGDQTSFNLTLYNQFKSFSTDKRYITKSQLAEFRAVREADSKARNPTFTFGLREQFVAYGEAALLVISLSDNTGNIRIDWMDKLFIEERFPVELGWTPRPISTLRVLTLAGELRGRSFTGLGF
ncbi:hypothetical protein HDU67_004153 [Dinochytrium kinnereticum]|nr:hypothetical protein HDU67_004153 [Dinochytrium kinnereticum]